LYKWYNKNKKRIEKGYKKKKISKEKKKLRTPKTEKKSNSKCKNPKKYIMHLYKAAAILVKNLKKSK